MKLGCAALARLGAMGGDGGGDGQGEEHTRIERLRALPCWPEQSLQITRADQLKQELRFGEGRSNLNYVVQAGSSRWFARIGGDLQLYGIRREKEIAAARLAAHLGVGPVVHYFETGLLISELVRGHALTDADLRRALTGKDDSLLEALTAALRKLHAAPLPPEFKAHLEEPLSWSPRDLHRWLAFARRKRFSRLPVVQMADEILPQLEHAAGPLSPVDNAPCFCHFDLLADNIVLADSPVSPPRLFVVDYEYAQVGQPLADLAVLAMGCDDEIDDTTLYTATAAAAATTATTTSSSSASSTADAALLCSYLQLPSASPSLLRRFAALKVVAALRETLWGVVAELGGSAAIADDDAAAYTDANWRKLRRLWGDFSAKSE